MASTTIWIRAAPSSCANGYPSRMCSIVASATAVPVAFEDQQQRAAGQMIGEWIDQRPVTAGQAEGGNAVAGLQALGPGEAVVLLAADRHWLRVPLRHRTLPDTLRGGGGPGHLDARRVVVPVQLRAAGPAGLFLA